MKYYIDTSLVVALANDRDPNHEVALSILPKGGEKVISKLVLMELYSVYSRRLNVSDEELEAIVNYTVHRCGCKVEDVEFDKAIDLAVELSNRVKLKALDLLHLSASIVPVSEIISLDKEIINAKNKLTNHY